MASTYVNDLRLNEMATGDQSGSWGTVTNTNLELIAEAFSYGTEAITTNADTHTTTIADGATDPGRSMFLKYTGTLDSACTITIGPNTVSKLWFIENATSGSQNIIIKQGSGATVTIASGKTKVIYSDGVGSGAKMVDAFAALDVGALSGTTGTFSGAVSGTTGTFSGAVSGASATFDGGVDIDNINIDGTTIALSSGDLTLDVAGELIIDADSSSIVRLKDAGTEIGLFYGTSSDFYIKSQVADKDLIFQGNDNGSTITALTLDMSDGGFATFNKGIELGGNIVRNADLGVDVSGDITLDADGGQIFLKDNNVQWLELANGGSGPIIKSSVSNKDIQFEGVDGGSDITALTLDMSDAGTATFNHDIKLGDNSEIVFGADGDLKIFCDNSGNYIRSQTSNMDLNVVVNDGGNIITALSFDASAAGAATFNSDVNATNFNSTSDATLKTNVETLTGSLDAVKSLRGVSFDWLENGGSEIGVIAQEVEDVLPNVVNTNEDGIKSVKYGNIVAVLIEAMKEQQAQIDELKSQLNS